MPSAPVDTVTMSASPSKRTKARIHLKFTKPNGHTIELKTDPRRAEPTDDMIAMAGALADYLTTGKRPAGWSGA